MGSTRTSILEILRNANSSVSVLRSSRIGGIDAETRDLALLTALSLSFAGVAWILGYVILGSIFFALGVVAALGLAKNHWL